MECTVIRADIATQEADVWVNAAGTICRWAVASPARSALAKADELGCESIVVPILGTGVAGSDAGKGTRPVYEEIRDYRPSSLTDVRVIAYSDAEYERLAATACVIGVSET